MQSSCLVRVSFCRPHYLFLVEFVLAAPATTAAAAAAACCCSCCVFVLICVLLPKKRTSQVFASALTNAFSLIFIIYTTFLLPTRSLLPSLPPSLPHSLLPHRPPQFLPNLLLIHPLRREGGRKRRRAHLPTNRPSSSQIFSCSSLFKLTTLSHTRS